MSLLQFIYKLASSWPLHTRSRQCRINELFYTPHTTVATSANLSKEYGTSLRNVKERGSSFQLLFAASSAVDQAIVNSSHGGNNAPICTAETTPGRPGDALALELVGYGLWPLGFCEGVVMATLFYLHRRLDTLSPRGPCMYCMMDRSPASSRYH